MDRRADLKRFVAESNRIEGITRAPTGIEVDALEGFLELTRPVRDDLTKLVEVFQPGEVLRDQPGLDVYVGNHTPPPGGPAIPLMLDNLLALPHVFRHPYFQHHNYETLHPYTDGNGRSGRALWLWGMKQLGGREWQRALQLGFLHLWYYQSLEFERLGK